MSMHAQPAVDDRQVVGRIAAGDRDALAELYQRYQRILFSYLQQLTPDYGLAEELLQDTLVAVWKSAHRFEGRSSVQTWLIGIARRQAHNTLRQRKLPLIDEAELDVIANGAARHTRQLRELVERVLGVGGWLHKIIMPPLLY